jgi:hypothetical protein
MPNKLAQLLIKHYLCTVKLQRKMETTKKTTKNLRDTSLLGQFRELLVGETLTVDVSRSSYVRMICARFGLEWNRKFKCRTDRTTRTITATRVF